MNPLIILVLMFALPLFFNIRRDILNHRDWKRSGIKDYTEWSKKTGRGLYTKKVWKVY